MTWWVAIPEILLATLWLFLPGMLLVRAARIHGIPALLAAPPLSVGVLAVLAVAHGVVGVPWNGLWAGVGVAVVAGAVLAVRVAVNRITGPRSTRIELVNAGHGRCTRSWWLFGGIALGAVVTLVPLVQGLRPDLVHLSWDPVFHLSATRYAIDTANASSFHIQLVNNQVATGTTGPFYPAAWHGIAALSTVGSVLRSSNALTLVVAGLAWPAGLAALGRVVAPHRPAVGVIAPVIGSAYFAFPTFLSAWGWPNALAVALLPGALAWGIAVLRPAAAGAAPRVMCALATALALAGIGLSHPNGVLSFGVIATPLVVGLAVAASFSALRAPSGPRRAVAVGGPLVAAVAWCAAWWTVLVLAGQHVGDFSQQGTSGLWAGIERTLVGTNTGRYSNLVLLALLAVGVIVVAWRRGNRWLLVGLAAFAWLSGLAEGDYRFTWLTQAWFKVPERIIAPAVVLLALVIAIGLDAVIGQAERSADRLAPRVAPRVAHGRRRPIGRWTTAAGTVVALGLVAGTGALSADQRRAFLWDWTVGVSQPESQGSIITIPEMEMLQRLDGQLTPGARILGSPFNGSTFAYAVAGIPVVFTNFSGRWSADASLLAESFAEIHQNPEVCAALRRLGVEYYYVDATVYHPGHPFHAAYAGLPQEPPQPGFELVDSGGSARLYRITVCD